VNILINNAGIVQGKRILDLNEGMAHKTMAVNYESNLWLVREFVPDMVAKDEGQVVFISSVTAIQTNIAMGDYSASKAAQHALADTLRLELRHTNVITT